jgi:hypothetical protein
MSPLTVALRLVRGKNCSVRKKLLQKIAALPYAASSGVAFNLLGELVAHFDWPGATTLRAQATDMAGRSQPQVAEWNRLGYGAQLHPGGPDPGRLTRGLHGSGASVLALTPATGWE